LEDHAREDSAGVCQYWRDVCQRWQSARDRQLSVSRVAPSVLAVAAFEL
jgi:hypothetical protein